MEDNGLMSSYDKSSRQTIPEFSTFRFYSRFCKNQIKLFLPIEEDFFIRILIHLVTLVNILYEYVSLKEERVNIINQLKDYYFN